MAEKLKLIREVITIPEDRTMNIYTFELDGKPMPEMEASDVQPTVDPSKPIQSDDR